MKNKSKPKFWRGLVVMCGDAPMLIKEVDWDEGDGYAYQDADSGWWWSEGSLFRMTSAQAGFAKEKSPPGFPASYIYYRKDSK
jgi:hypothetical protein